MGTGKTFVTTRLWQDSAMPRILIIGPASVAGVWAQVMKDYRISPTLMMYISMDTLSKGGTSQPMLTRFSYENKDDLPEETGETATFVAAKKGELYVPTPLLKQWIRDGCFVVLDEVQNFKNTSNRHHAVRCIIKNLYFYDNLVNGMMTSRLALLSGTLTDKEETVINYMRLLGVVTDRALGRRLRGGGGVVYEGLQQMIDFCRRFSATETEEALIRANDETDRADFVKILYILYREVFQKYVVSSMGKVASEFEPDLGNGFYIAEQAEQNAIRNALVEAEEAVEPGVDGRIDLGAFNAQLQIIEKSKVNIVVRHAYNILTNPRKPHAKVVLSFNYLASIEDAVRRLGAMLPHIKPIVLNGSVTPERRSALVASFQMPTDEFRLIIANMKVISVGLSLDDRDGRFPRYAFGSPSYHVMDMQQWTYRFTRSQTKSQAVVRFVYESNSAETEVSLLEKIAYKSGVLADTNVAQVEGGVLFPSQFETFHEAPGVGNQDVRIM